MNIKENRSRDGGVCFSLEVNLGTQLRSTEIRCFSSLFVLFNPFTKEKRRYTLNTKMISFSIIAREKGKMILWAFSAYRHFHERAAGLFEIERDIKVLILCVVREICVMKSSNSPLDKIQLH